MKLVTSSWSIVIQLSIPIFNVAGNNKTQPGLQSKCPTFLPILAKFEISRKKKTFVEVPNIKFHGNSRSRVDRRRQTDGRSAAHYFGRRENFWRFTVSGNKKKYVYLNARCLKPYTTFTTYGFFLRHFCKSLFSISSPVALGPIAGQGLLILEVS